MDSPHKGPVIQGLVKVQFRGPKLYKKKRALFQEEFYLPRIFRSSSLNLHTFHVINIVFWWRIFFRKHGKSTPQRSARPPCFGRRRCDHDITMQVHESSQPITRCKAWQPHAGNAIDRFRTGCHVDAMAAVWQNHIGKNIKITFKLRPSIHNRIANLFMEA